MSETDSRTPGSGSAPPPPVRTKAWGRSLWHTQPPLSSAETKLLEACADGRSARIAHKIPDAATADNTIRAELIRFLALGGDETAPVHERGIRIDGAWITGDVDLEGCEVKCPIQLNGCHFEGGWLMHDARIASLILQDGTTVAFISGDRLSCSGSLFLRNGFHARGAVRLVRASIKGDLELFGSRFDGQTSGDELISLHCEGIEVGGNVYGRPHAGRPLTAHGFVTFYAGRIGGNYAFPEAVLGGLNCEGARIGGLFDLGDATLSKRLRLLGVKVDGDMHLNDCTFQDCEVILTRGEIKGRFVFVRGKGKITRMVVRGATVNSLVDEIASWELAGHLVLDGFTYDRILGVGYMRSGADVHHATPIDAQSRISWLRMQDARDLGEDFKPQPWEQVAEVLANMGHDDDARSVSIEKQIQKRRAWVIQSRKTDSSVRRLRLRLQAARYWIYGQLSRYGYRPSLLIGWALAVSLVCAGAFWLGAEKGVMAPTDKRILESALHKECAGNWTKCTALVGKYPNFEPLAYSFDLILPVIATQQAKDWAPQTMRSDGARSWTGTAVAALARLENLFGWIIGLMFVVTVSGLVKRD